MEKVYMATTADEYELPCIVGSAQEVADFIGITVKSFHTIMWRHSNDTNHNGYRFYRIEIGEDVP